MSLGVNFLSSVKTATSLGSVSPNQSEKRELSCSAFASELYRLLEEHQIPYCVLNPCERNADEWSDNIKVVGYLRDSAFRKLLRVLDECGLSYRVLPPKASPHQGPANIDLAIHPDDLPRCAAVLRSLNNQGYRLVRCPTSSFTAHYFTFMWAEGPKLDSITVNLIHEWRLKLLNVREVLAKRQKGKDLWLAHPEAEFTHMLLRGVLEGTDFPDHSQDQRSTALADQVGKAWVEKLTRELFGEKWQGNLWDACANSRFRIPGAKLRRQFWKNALVHHPLRSLQFWLRECLRMINGGLSPTGVFIALLGPDGVGKSSLISQLTAAVGGAFPEQRVFHFRPMLFWSRKGTGPVTDPHGKPRRPAWQSMAKICSLVLDYCFGYRFLVRPMLRRSGFVVFDRYLYDLWVDTKRYRYGGPLWLARLVCYLVPTPDLLFVLSAPPEVIIARKSEVPLQDLRLLCSAYQRIVNELPNAVPINMDRSLGEAVTEASQAIIEHLAGQVCSEKLFLGIPHEF